MPKVKCISRNADHFVRETKLDLHKIQRNYSQAVDRLAHLKEHQLALNAVKLDRIHAKPFVKSLEGHCEGVRVICKSRKKVHQVYSGDDNGEIIAWNLDNFSLKWKTLGHRSAISGLACNRTSDILVSVSKDSIINMWDISDEAYWANNCEVNAVNTITTSEALTGVDCNWHADQYATSGDTLKVYNMNRNEPLKDFKYQNEQVKTVSFNPSQTNVILSCSNESEVMLYDVRSKDVILGRIKMMNRSNKAVWNPQHPNKFVVANDDGNLYTHDMRNFKYANSVHKGHTDAVIDVDFAPTGHEFVSGSYDRSVRIFGQNANHEREIYFTKRQQRIWAVQFSMDAKFVFCGSEEHNIRVWKAKANDRLGRMAPRDRAKRLNDAKLVEKHKYHPEIKRINNHRQLPKHIYHEKKKQAEMRIAERRKETNRRIHSKPGTVPIIAERKRHLFKTQHNSDSDSD